MEFSLIYCHGLVLDWNLEPEVGQAVREANRQYLLPYIQNMMAVMTASSQGLPESAHSFACSQILPDIDVSTIRGDLSASLTHRSIHLYREPGVL